MRKEIWLQHIGIGAKNVKELSNGADDMVQCL